MEMVNKANDFIEKTGMFYEWCKFQRDQFYKWIGKSEWLHSDRWSATYDWVNDGRFANVDIPEDIVNCLVEEWETNAISLKVGI